MHIWLVVNDVFAWIIVLQAIFFVGLVLPQLLGSCPRVWLHMMAAIVAVYIGTIYLLTILDMLPILLRSLLLRPAFSLTLSMFIAYALSERR